MAVGDNWSSVESIIQLDDDLPVECFDGIDELSHLELCKYNIIYFITFRNFDKYNYACYNNS